MTEAFIPTEMMLAPWPSRHLAHELLTDQAARTPDAIALVYNDHHLSYAELEQRSNQLAHVLQDMGIGPEDLVGLVLERSLEMVVGLLAVLKAGGAYVPLDPTYPPERLAYMLQDSAPLVLLTQEQLLPQLPHLDGVRVLCLDRDWPRIARASSTPPVSGVEAEHLAYVIYTSGSTGLPKGVQVTHRGIANLAQAQQRIFDVHAQSRVLQFASINFDASVSEIFVTLLAGAILCLASREQLLPGPALSTLAREQAITVVTLPPSALAPLTPTDLPDLHTLVVAGEACPLDLARRWATHCRFINAYGPTEFTVCASASVYEASSPVLSLLQYPQTDRKKEGLGDIPRPADRQGSIYQEKQNTSIDFALDTPITNTQLYVLDAHLQPVAHGAAGELFLAGPGLARGYLNRPEQTAERFVPHPFSSEPGARLYRTGDRVRLLPDGSLEFLGRVDQQVKLRGYRIELEEIESVLHSHPAIQQAVVVLREDIPGDKRLVAYLVPHTGMTLSLPQLRTYLKTRLPDYMLPSAFVPLRTLPLLANGKINRRALPAPDQERPELSTPFVAPATETERGLARIWSEVLGITRIGVQDNFFELGGHSLRATLVQLRVRDVFGVDISLDTLFASPTIAELAEAIARQQRSGYQLPVLQPVSREQELPLSFAQERVWFIYQFHPGNIAYNAQAILRFTGNLNIPALRQSLTEIVRRHEIFRTTFPTVDGRPVQKIHAPWDVQLPLLDLQDLPPAERESTASQIIAEEGRKPFDLLSLPLVRWTLIRLHEHEHILCYVEQHLVHDGWSFTVFLRELQTLYTAFSAGKLSPLPELPVQFADFAYRQRRWLQEDQEEVERQRAYWKKQLADMPDVLQLPYDHPRPPVPSFEGAALRLQLPDPLANELRELSRREGVTLFMLMLAVFKVLLYRYTGREDIPVGSSVANRRWKGIDQVIGMVLNTVVLRTSVPGDMPFRDLLHRVRDTALEAYAHQDLPFDKVVEAVQPARDISYNPLFQVTFNFHDSPMPVLQLPELTVAVQEAINNGSSKFDLSLTVIPRAEQQSGLHKDKEQSITLIWEYSADLFEQATIDRMQRHFQNLLESIVANPQQKLADLPLLTADEREHILALGRGPRITWPDRQYIHERIAELAARTPDAVALVYDDHLLTYGELERRSNQLAHTLQDRSIGPECLVGIAVERSLEMVIGLLAVLKAGGAYVPLDPTYPPERLAYILHDSALQVLLTQERLLSHLPRVPGLPMLCLDRDWPQIAQASPLPPVSLLSEDHLAYVIYTSGSTGQPKGVQISHRSLSNLTRAQQRVFAIQPDSRVLQFATMNFDISVSEFFGALLAGATLILGSREQLMPGPALSSLASRQALTIMMLTPSALVPLAPEALPDLRTMIMVGELCPLDLANRWAPHCQRFINAYGPTEFTVYATVGDHVLERPFFSLGASLANTQFYVLDAHLQPVPIGVPGELYLGGTGAARGYLNKPDLTAERFVPDPFSGVAGARLYRTGDRVRMAPDGNLEFLGRIDFQVKLRGHRIELGEIESILRAHPAIRQAVVMLREDTPGQKRLVAYLVLQSGASLPLPELRAYLKEQLPDYMIPAAFVVQEALPLLANGKINRRALPPPEQERPELSTPFVAPGDETERTLAHIWSEVLEITQIGVYDNFFELGGHSLLIPQVYTKLRECNITDVTLIDLFHYPTIKTLAEHLKRREADIDGTGSARQLARSVARTALRRDMLKKQRDFTQQRRS